MCNLFLCESGRQQKQREKTDRLQQQRAVKEDQEIVSNSDCELMAGLGWVRLISQGVVANRQGARPKMTILECYYTKIRTPTVVYNSEHTIKLFSIAIYH